MRRAGTDLTRGGKRARVSPQEAASSSSPITTLLPETLRPILNLLSGEDARHFVRVLVDNKEMALMLARAIQSGSSMREWAAMTLALTPTEQAEIDNMQLTRETRHVLYDAVVFLADFESRQRPGQLSRAGHAVAQMVARGEITGWQRWDKAYGLANRLNRIMGMALMTRYFREPVLNVTSPTGALVDGGLMKLGVSLHDAPPVEIGNRYGDCAMAPLFTNSLNLRRPPPPPGSLQVNLVYHSDIPRTANFGLNIVFGVSADGSEVPLFEVNANVVMDPTLRSLRIPVTIREHVESGALPNHLDLGEGYLVVEMHPLENNLVSLAVRFSLTALDVDTIVALPSGIVQLASVQDSRSLVEAVQHELYSVLRAIHDDLHHGDIPEDVDKTPNWFTYTMAVDYGIDEDDDNDLGRYQFFKLYGPTLRMFNDLLTDENADTGDILQLFRVFGSPPLPVDTPLAIPIRVDHIPYLQCATCRLEHVIITDVDPTTHKGYCKTCAHAIHFINQ